MKKGGPAKCGAALFGVPGTALMRKRRRTPALRIGQDSQARRTIRSFEEGEAGDTARAATSGGVQDLRREAGALKECVADLTLENCLLKESMIADGRDEE